MKNCPFCAELIQDEAIKCRYCAEFLPGHNMVEPTAKENIDIPTFIRKKQRQMSDLNTESAHRGDLDTPTFLRKKNSNIHDFIKGEY